MTAIEAAFEAQRVWNVWRRILREPALQQAVLGTRPPSEQALQAHMADAADRRAALAYAAQADRTRWFVENYRFRLRNSFVHALATAAPLTLRALLNAGATLPTLAEEFLERQQWRDGGPFVYRHAADALAFLSTHPVTCEPQGLRALMRLERCGIELMLRAAAPPETPSAPPGGLARTGRAVYHLSDRLLSPWLRDKPALGRSPLREGTEHWLVCWPAPEAAHRLVRVPERAAGIYQVLEHPCSEAQWRAALQARGAPPHTPGDAACIEQLLACGALTRGPAE